MKTGTAIWFIGWMFTLGFVNWNPKTDDIDIGTGEVFSTLIVWPVVIGGCVSEIIARPRTEVEEGI